MTVELAHGPNADLVAKIATRVDEYRVRWETVERKAIADIDEAFAKLEEHALSAFRADDGIRFRWRRLPSNLGHLLNLAAGAAESSIAAAELDLLRARRALRAIGGGRP